MADLQKNYLNGIVQTKAEKFVEGEAKNGVLYFVRTDAHGEEGYLYLNGRKYGNVEEVREELQTILGSMPSGKTISELFEEVNNSISNLSEELESVEGDVASAETRINNVETKLASDETKIKENEDKIAANEAEIAENAAAIESANTRIDNTDAVVKDLAEAVDLLNADSGTTGSVDQKIAEAIENLPADMVVESGRVEEISGVTYLILTIKGGSEVKIEATKLVDTYKAGDDYVKVDNYKISLNIDELKKIFETKEEAEAIVDKLNEAISGLTAVQEDVEALEGEVSSLSGEVSNNAAAIETNQTNISALEDRVDAVDDTLEVMSGKMQDMQEEISSIEEKSQKLVAGDGIEISGDTISANADAVTTDDIQVTVDLGAGFSKDTTIPAGTSIQDLLVKLLSKELWDTTTPTVSTAFTVSLASGFAVTLDKSGNVEVGDSVVVNALEAKDTTTHTQSYTVSKFDYGFKIGKDGEYNSASANTVNLTPTAEGNANILSETFTGFVNEDNTAVASIRETADTLASKTVYVTEGTNKVVANQTGDTYISVAEEPQVYYTATNLKNYTKSADDSSDNTFTASPTWTASKTAMSSSTASVTGCYKYYYGYTEAALDYTTLFTNKDSLNTLTGLFMTAATATIATMESSDAKSSLVLVLPASYSITGTKNKLGSDVDVITTWIEQNTFDYVNGNKTTSYKVYVKHSAEATKYTNITFKK